jgi:hypothetical protein
MQPSGGSAASACVAALQALVARGAAVGDRAEALWARMLEAEASMLHAATHQTGAGHVPGAAAETVAAFVGALVRLAGAQPAAVAWALLQRIVAPALGLLGACREGADSAVECARASLAVLAAALRLASCVASSSGSRGGAAVPLLQAVWPVLVRTIDGVLAVASVASDRGAGARAGALAHAVVAGACECVAAACAGARADADAVASEMLPLLAALAARQVATAEVLGALAGVVDSVAATAPPDWAPSALVSVLASALPPVLRVSGGASGVAGADAGDELELVVCAAFDLVRVVALMAPAALAAAGVLPQVLVSAVTTLARESPGAVHRGVMASVTGALRAVLRQSSAAVDAAAAAALPSDARWPVAAALVHELLSLLPDASAGAVSDAVAEPLRRLLVWPGASARAAARAALLASLAGSEGPALDVSGPMVRRFRVDAAGWSEAVASDVGALLVRHADAGAAEAGPLRVRTEGGVDDDGPLCGRDGDPSERFRALVSALAAVARGRGAVESLKRWVE